jgi:hypothetical protein
MKNQSDHEDAVQTMMSWRCNNSADDVFVVIASAA